MLAMAKVEEGFDGALKGDLFLGLGLILDDLDFYLDGRRVLDIQEVGLKCDSGFKGPMRLYDELCVLSFCVIS